MSETRHLERHSKSPRVLLVKEEPLARETITKALDGAGLGVAGAASAEAALWASEVDTGTPPAVLVTDTDLARDGMDGLALAAEARRRWPGVGVVYVTGRPSRLDGHVLGARDRFLPKPVAPVALVRAVRGLVVDASPCRAP
jgi:two-component system OmpR family response regulator